MEIARAPYPNKQTNEGNTWGKLCISAFARGVLLQLVMSGAERDEKRRKIEDWHANVVLDRTLIPDQSPDTGQAGGAIASDMPVRGNGVPEQHANASGGGEARIISVDSSDLDMVHVYMNKSEYEERRTAWGKRALSNYSTINDNLRRLYAMSNEGMAAVAKDEQQMSPILKYVESAEDPMDCLEFKHEFTFPSDIDADTEAAIKEIVANLKELLNTGDAEVDRWVIDAELFEPRGQRSVQSTDWRMDHGDHVHVQVAGTLATVVDPVAGRTGPGEGDLVFLFNYGCTFNIMDQVVRYGNTYVQFDPRLVINRLVGPHNRPAFKISKRMPNPMPDTLWVIAVRGAGGWR